MKMAERKLESPVAAGGVLLPPPDIKTPVNEGETSDASSAETERTKPAIGRQLTYYPRNNSGKAPTVQPSATIVFIQAIVLGLEGVLVGKRLIAPHEHTWCFPGGPLRYGEHPCRAAVKFVQQQTGLVVRAQPEIWKTVGTFMHETLTDKYEHVITLFVVCNWPIAMIPEARYGDVEFKHRMKRLAMCKQPEVCMSEVYSEWKYVLYEDFVLSQNAQKKRKNLAEKGRGTAPLYPICAAVEALAGLDIDLDRDDTIDFDADFVLCYV